jgi:hypothetical protein
MIGRWRTEVPKKIASPNSSPPVPPSATSHALAFAPSRSKLPLAFTEHGAIMAATVLNSPRAVEVSVYVVRAFIRLRELASSHHELAKRLDALEQKTEALALKHDAFSRNTRNQLKQVFDALRDLMTPPEPPTPYWICRTGRQRKEGARTP